MSIALLLICVTLFGCAEMTNKSDICQEVVASWIGGDIENAILQFGPPTGEKKLMGGRTAMSWQTMGSSYFEGTGGTWTRTLILVADKNGTIASGSYPGCR